MRPSRILVLFFSCMLSACNIERQEKQLAQCQRETQPIGYPFDMRGFNADLMDICMRLAGYRFDVSHRDCKQPLSVPLRVKAYCYVPTSHTQAWLYWFERTLRGE